MNNQAKKPQNESFDLEEVVNNTNQAQGEEPSNAEIVAKMQQGKASSTEQKQYVENLDTVVPPKEQREAYTKQAEKQETVDDILQEEQEEEKKSSKSGWIALIIVAILILGLIRLGKRDRNNDEELGTGSGSIVADNEDDTQDDEDIETDDEDEDKEVNQNLDNLGGDYSYNHDDDEIYYKKTVIPNTDKATFEVLGKNYAKDKNNVYYKGQKMPSVETDKFQVISKSGDHKLSGIIVNSKNLLNHLKVKAHREFLMTTIASITNKNQNVKDELTLASVHSMNSFKDDFDELNALQWGDDMTEIQRAKFGVIFLYIKIIQSLESDEIRMSKAKEELRYFINNSDKILKEYGPEKDRDSVLEGDIGYDQYCVYLDGDLFGCFLNEIFIEARD